MERQKLNGDGKGSSSFFGRTGEDAEGRHGRGTTLEFLRGASTHDRMKLVMAKSRTTYCEMGQRELNTIRIEEIHAMMITVVVNVYTAMRCEAGEYRSENLGRDSTRMSHHAPS